MNKYEIYALPRTQGDIPNFFYTANAPVNPPPSSWGAPGTYEVLVTDITQALADAATARVQLIATLKATKMAFDAQLADLQTLSPQLAAAGTLAAVKPLVQAGFTDCYQGLNNCKSALVALVQYLGIDQ